MTTLNFNVPTRNQVDATSQAIFDNLEKGLGKVPNLYAYIGHSSNALSSYLNLQKAQSKSTFNNKEKEAVFLAVSEVNGCQYCQAAHTTLGKMNGFTEKETLQIRAGEHPDHRTNTIAKLAASIQTSNGRPDTALLNAFFELGYDQKALVDLVLLVADKVFANYIHNITQIEIDFPKAQPLTETTAI